MLKIEKILLATDLSQASRQAYDHAVDLAQRFQAKIVLIHVNEAASFGFHSSAELVNYLSVLGERIGAQLNEEARILSDRGVDVDVQEAAGVPFQEILAAVDREAIDLVILTRRGASPARHLHFGSTAKRVVRHVDVPLLVVPGGEDGEAFTGYHRILATTDFSDDSYRGLRVALDFASHFGAAVTAAHVLRLPNPLPAVPGEPPLYFPRESIEDLQSFHERELAQLVKEFGADKLDHIVTINADAADGVLETARDVNADLIAIPTHGKGALRAVILGSTSERVIKLADLPVLILPREFLRRTVPVPSGD